MGPSVPSTVARHEDLFRRPVKDYEDGSGGFAHHGRARGFFPKASDTDLSSREYTPVRPEVSSACRTPAQPLWAAFHGLRGDPFQATLPRLTPCTGDKSTQVIIQGIERWNGPILIGIFTLVIDSS